MQSHSGLLGTTFDITQPGGQPTAPPGRRFTPNLFLSRERSRVNSDQEIPDDYSNDDDDGTFKEKNREFFFGREEEDFRKRCRGEAVFKISSRKSSCETEEVYFHPKNADYYFGASEQLTENFRHFAFLEDLDEESFLDQAINFAKAKGGECLSSTCRSKQQALIYKCKLGHTWESNQTLLTGSWCNKCQGKLANAREYGKAMGWVLISEEPDITIEFKCQQGHTLQADFKRYKRRNFCAHCRASQRKQRKEELAHEEERLRAKLEEEQQHLFKEARKLLVPEPTSNALEAETMINQDATQKAEDFLSKETTCSFSQAFNTYKILFSTVVFIELKYFSRDLTKEEKTSNFRKLAKVLHPDKNPHPNANDAFLKMMKVYTQSVLN